jgi:hypothetical protein
VGSSPDEVIGFFSIDLILLAALAAELEAPQEGLSSMSKLVSNAVVLSGL